jgi:predicted Fe-Mo cluster-binding NifX family protein
VAVVATVDASRQEAELIVGMLKSHGVKAVVSADDAGGVDLALQAQGVRVLVPEADVSRAQKLLHSESAVGREPNSFQRLVIRLLGGPANG